MPNARLRIRSLVLPLTTLGLVAAQIIDPSPVWKGLLTALGGLWLISYLWARALHRNVTLQRAMRYGWAQVGDRLEEQFVLRNESRLPATWVEISDGSTLPGYSVRRATGVDGGSQNAWTTNGTCTRRGVYTLGHTRLVTGDPLGIYEVEIAQPESVTLTVMPPIIPLPFIDIATGGWRGEGRPRIHAAEQTMRAETVRAYAPGDSLRLIHWPTTARREEPYVRVLEGAPASDWWIALDFEAAVQAGEGGESTAELGVIAAASLAERGLQAHRAVGFISAGAEPAWIRPATGEQQRWEILRALATLDTGSTDLAALLETIGPELGRQATLLVITPSTDGEWIKPLIRLFGRGITPNALLIDPASFDAGRSTGRLVELLNEAGISHHIVGRDLFKRPEARPGPAGHWEWRVLPTGKAVPVRRPADMTWKQLQ